MQGASDLPRQVRRPLRLLNVIPHAPGYSSGVTAWISLLFMGPLYVLAGVGALRLAPPARRLLLAPILATLAVHVFILGSVRYRLPLMPILAVLAGAAWLPRDAGSCR